MTERPTGPTDESPDKDKKPSKFARPIYTGVAGVLGGYIGGISYGITRMVGGGENTAERIGIGVGGAIGSMGLGAMLGNITLSEAEDYTERGKTLKSRLKVLQATIEGATGFGGAGAIAAIEAGGGFTTTSIATAISAAFGGFSTYLQYKERTMPIPEPNLPHNSMERDTSFPDRKDGTKFPPVYRVNSLKDLRKFREAYRDILLKKHESLPDKTDTRPEQIGITRLATAVIIIPALQHYPAFDPEKTSDMKLSDSDENILVHPCREAHMFWPVQTSFETIFGLSRNFDQGQWDYWKRRSWRQDVVILAQLQAPKMANIFRVEIKPESVIDNYWLLDILGGDGGVRRSVKENEPEGQTRPAINPKQI